MRHCIECSEPIDRNTEAVDLEDGQPLGICVDCAESLDDDHIVLSPSFTGTIITEF